MAQTETETETAAVSARSVYTLHVANVSCMQSHTLLRYILSPGISCRRQQYICQHSRHILSPATTYAGVYDIYCRPSVHIVAGDDICRNSCLCLQGMGGGGGGVETDRQTGQRSKHKKVQTNAYV